MSNLYGFKYIVKGYGGYIEYIVLSEFDGRLYIDKYYYGTKHHFDITDKIGAFCHEIADLDIDSWNLNDYQSSILWFPPADDWTFQINTDALSVACRGQGEFPPNWKEFWEAFNRMCNNE